MPVNVPKKLPAIDLLKRENIFVMDEEQALKQDIRPLQIVVLNLMPLKIETETDLIRILSNSPLQIELTFLRLESHTPKNTPVEHLQEFYQGFTQLKNKNFDGMIVTGAPVEKIEFEEVVYWDELRSIMDWAKDRVTSTFYICWAAQAGLYHKYNIPKYPLKAKLFGVFEHEILDPFHPLFRGFDSFFYAPHSRHTELISKDILKEKELEILSTSEEAGVYIVEGRKGREFYVTGHSEYAPYTLDREYKRDVKADLPIALPKNYYKQDEVSMGPVVKWRAHGHLLFSNWLNYYVYQKTPFKLNK